MFEGYKESKRVRELTDELNSALRGLQGWRDNCMKKDEEIAKKHKEMWKYKDLYEEEKKKVKELEEKNEQEGRGNCFAFMEQSKNFKEELGERDKKVKELEERVKLDKDVINNFRKKLHEISGERDSYKCKVERMEKRAEEIIACLRSKLKACEDQLAKASAFRVIPDYTMQGTWEGKAVKVTIG